MEHTIGYDVAGAFTGRTVQTFEQKSGRIAAITSRKGA